MNAVGSFFNRKGVKRVIIFALLALVLYLVRSMINIVLLTFIFSFLMDRLVSFVSDRLPLNRKLVVFFMYTAIVSLMGYGIFKYLPIIVTEISQLIKMVSAFYTQPSDNPVVQYIVSIIKNNQISDYLNNGVSFLLKSATDLSKTSLQVLISIMLSLFFLLEKPRLVQFTEKFKTSKIAPFYNEIAFFGKKFTGTFGKVIEAQFIIAIVNSLLTVIALSILDFPQLFGLAIMIFFLGLIPVAGVIISLIPLSLIAYSIGGIMTVVYVGVVIAIIHAIEAYILNPKLMSSKTDLPVFYTFVVLIFSEHFFGVWGLIIGIPVFVFLLDVLEVTGEEDRH